MRRRATFRWRRAALVLAVAPLALAACSASDSDDAPLLDAAVRVEAAGCRSRPTVGSGSFLAPGLVLTVAHVVAGSTEVQVRLGDGEVVPAEVVAIDREKDLAVLLAVSNSDAAPIPLRTGRARSSDRGEFVVWRDGTAVADHFQVLTFVDIDAMDIDHQHPATRKGFEISASVDHGDSGSVLVVGDRAVGIVFGRSPAGEHRAWATDIHEAAPLLTEAEHRPADAGPADVGACAR